MHRALWLSAVLVLAFAPPAQAAVGPFAATSIEPTGRVAAGAAPTSRLAETDPDLLGRAETALLPVLIKLDHDPVATYAGGVPGIAATSPSGTGRKLSRSGTERAYEDYLAAREDRFIAELAVKVPGASVRQRLRTVYGGVSATVPANKVGEVLGIDGVVAVQRDELHQPLTDASTGFIGAGAVYPRVGGDRNAGRGVIVGVIDTGAWPEHPSFADQGNLKAPPAKADGAARACDFGDNPLTKTAYTCNNKLIGGAAFLETYLARHDGEQYPTARDSGGHGTHTASTAAGNVVNSAAVFGVDRGPLQGVAPGAWLSVYKALGEAGGYGSDIARAVGQAVLDGVDVLNYSVSGGTDPYTDPVELSFLDAYAAGVFVAASAGNSGPGQATANHLAPWVTTVGASTEARSFVSTLTLKAGADKLTLKGASITSGVGAATPVVLAESVAGYGGGALCDKPADRGVFVGKIVACQRGGNARAAKGYNVVQGGAVGMVLYNPSLADVETDNHWLPTVHLADGARFKAFMAGHTSVTSTFTDGKREKGQADVLAAFSARGPGGPAIKPDLTAPGVQILAGNTPTPHAVEGGPPGELFQAIAGTSMAAPHVAGAAVLLKALHRSWTPGQIKSALMTTARTAVLKEDLKTAAGPLDRGSGRIDLVAADDPGLTFDESAERMLALGADPVGAVHLNLPSVYAPTMPGQVTTVRTARNVSGATQTYRVSVRSPARSRIAVLPSVFTLAAGRSVALKITITSTAPSAPQVGEVRLDPARPGLPTLHLPVAFTPKPGNVELTSDCAAAVVWRQRTVCTITAKNASLADAVANLTTTVDAPLTVSGVGGATKTGPRSVTRRGLTIPGARPGKPTLKPGTIAGYRPLSEYGIQPSPIGDQETLTYEVPQFVYGGRAYTSLGADANGYLVVGDATGSGGGLPGRLPDVARPNNVLAPFWTDLDGTRDEGIRVARLTDGVSSWVVMEWQVDVAGTDANRHFQVWLGANGVEDVVFAYDPAALPAAPDGKPLLVGAENADGSAGQRLPAGRTPTADLRVTSAVPATASYTVQLTGAAPGIGRVTTRMTASTVPGVSVVTSDVQVVLPPGGPTR
ncbi:S8 family serine peptidase [Phytohabitans rumicis]|uniref:S8 family serine peptidase n=1 Tax=Phytohabitans rumicis TaxID=1076125 RepID=UPI0031F1819B